MALNLPSQQLSHPSLFNFGGRDASGRDPGGRDSSGGNFHTNNNPTQQQQPNPHQLSTSQSQHQFPTASQQHQFNGSQLSASQTFPKLKSGGGGGASVSASSPSSRVGSANTPSPISRGKNGRNSVHFCQVSSPFHNSLSVLRFKLNGSLYNYPRSTH